jgi:PAS domain S-box-containing protein
MEMNKTYNFLILEDNPDDASLFRRKIENEWENVFIKIICTPQDLRIALAEIEWDVVIADYSMPQFTGIDALRITRESNQEPLFYLTSGVKGEEIASEVMKAGARDYIDKNNPERLIITIKRGLIEVAGNRELYLARRELLKSEKKYQDIIALTPVGFYQSSPEGRFLEANNSMVKMLGYENVDELMRNASLKEVYYIEGKREELQTIFDSTNLDKVNNIEVQYKKKDGTPIWVLLTSQAVRNEGGKTLFYNVFVVDISHQKDLDAEKQQMMIHWENTFNSMTDIIMLLSSEKRIIQINDAGCKFLKKTRDELIGMKCYEAVHKTKTNPAFCPTNIAVKSKKMEFTEIEQDGNYYKLTAWPILNNEREITGYSHSIIDITKRKKAEIELALYRDHLEELVKERTMELRTANVDLEEKNLDLRNMHKLFIGRENRIKDLRDQVKNLKEQLADFKKQR